MTKRDSSAAPSGFEAHSNHPSSWPECPATQSNPDREAPEKCPQHELANIYLVLSAKCVGLQSARNNATKLAPQRASAVKDLINVTEKAQKLADMMGSGIRKQMKWQPSCHRSGKRGAYSATGPSEAVFYALFNSEDKRVWKQKKIPLEDFENIPGELCASVDSLLIIESHDQGGQPQMGPRREPFLRLWTLWSLSPTHTLLEVWVEKIATFMELSTDVS